MNIDTELLDIMDLIQFTLSQEFIDKWKMKYGERILRLYQIKILNSLKTQKPIKLKSLVRFLVNDSGYNQELVKCFLLDIEYDIYSPILLGNLRSIEDQI